MKKLISLIAIVVVLSVFGIAYAEHVCGTVQERVYNACFSTLSSNGQTLTENLPAEAGGASCEVYNNGSNDKIIRVLIGSPSMANDVAPDYTGSIAFTNSGQLHFIFDVDSITEKFKVDGQAGDVMRVRAITGFGAENTAIINCILWPRI